MKHKYMSQDTLFITFNVWMAAGTVMVFTGHFTGSMVCYSMMLITVFQLLRSSWEDIKRLPKPTPPQPEKEDV